MMGLKIKHHANFGIDGLVLLEYTWDRCRKWMSDGHHQKMLVGSLKYQAC
jgi:hypothetical protein